MFLEGCTVKYYRFCVHTSKSISYKHFYNQVRQANYSVTDSGKATCRWYPL